MLISSWLRIDPAWMFFFLMTVALWGTSRLQAPERESIVSITATNDLMLHTTVQSNPLSA